MSGITKEGGIGSYLGLPESLGGAKSKIFAFLRERLEGRIESWSSKLLSKGGKEVLIKSVLSALPTYVMSCFRLPKNTTSLLASATARFWWGHNGRQGMHWQKWEKLCKPKVEGGLGFRILDDFNSALLAKQLWRLIQHPHSLLAQVMKARYYQTRNPMNSKKAYSPSYGWRSIQSSKFLLEKGLIKNIGSGATINVWEDNWIPDLWPRPAHPANHQFMPKLFVSDFIDRTNNTWKTDLLKHFFHSSDVSVIQGIFINKEVTSDGFSWGLTRSGLYTVKSGYRTIREIKNRIDFCNYREPSVKAILERVWQVKAPTKLKHFLWQSLSGCIAVNSKLRSRRINCEASCPRCGGEDETVNHSLFECPPATQIWAISMIPTNFSQFPTHSIYSNLDYLLSRGGHIEPIAGCFDCFPWLLWYIWKARNDKLFKGIDRSPADIIKIAIAEWQSWSKAQLDLTGPTMRAKPVQDLEGRATPLAPI